MSVVVQANSGANGLHEAKRFKKSAKFDDDDSSLSVDKLAQTYRSNLFDLEVITLSEIVLLDLASLFAQEFCSCLL